MQVFLSLFPTLLLFQLVVSECPNGCSGHGSCGYKDMCTCYKNYQGSDCSERTCPFGYAHTDTVKGDLNMNGVLTDTTVTTQVYLSGTTETFSSVDNEAHDYMECSNKGLCDRETGDCTCFDGYEGSACHRTSCPNQCSGHGTCESISEFASYGDGSVFSKGSIYGEQVYKLWDKKVTYGCKCDPWFTGSDCSLRNCKVGVDPLYEIDLIMLEEFRFKKNDFKTTGDYVTFLFWDYFGESYETEKVYFGTELIKNIENAFGNIPNDMFILDIACREEGSNGDILCALTGHHGLLRLVELKQIFFTEDATAPIITTTPKRGEDFTLTPRKTGKISISNVEGALTVAISEGPSFAANTAHLINVNGIYTVLIKASDNALSLGASIDLAKSYSLSAEDAIFYYGDAVTLVGASCGATIGSTTITCGSALSIALSPGDMIIYENQIFRVTSDVS